MEPVVEATDRLAVTGGVVVAGDLKLSGSVSLVSDVSRILISSGVEGSLLLSEDRVTLSSVSGGVLELTSRNLSVGTSVIGGDGVRSERLESPPGSDLVVGSEGNVNVSGIRVSLLSDLLVVDGLSGIVSIGGEQTLLRESRLISFPPGT